MDPRDEMARQLMAQQLGAPIGGNFSAFSGYGTRPGELGAGTQTPAPYAGAAPGAAMMTGELGGAGGSGLSVPLGAGSLELGAELSPEEKRLMGTYRREF